MDSEKRDKILDLCAEFNIFHVWQEVTSEKN